MTVTWPDHLLELRDWDALPEDNRFRLEVAEGVLIVTPRPMSDHQRAVTRLGYLINEQLPRELSAITEVDLIVAKNPLTVRAPDVLVASTAVAGSNPPRYEPADVRMVLEVLSPGSVRTDRVTKFSEYAETGIPYYWLVDLAAPVSLSTYTLIGGGYESAGEYTGRAQVPIDATDISIDLDALTTSRAQRL